MMAGSLEIRGTIDTKDIEKGFAKIEIGFSNVRRESRSTESDLSKMDIIGKGLSRTFLAVGAAATGMIYEASRKAPALAGDMARIQVSWDSMIRSLGTGLEPVFNKVAGWMEGIANWASGHTDLIATVIGGAGTIAAIEGLGKIAGLGSAIGVAGAALAPFLAPIAAGTVIAGLLALAGFTIGGALANTGGESTSVAITDQAKIQIAGASGNDLTDLQMRYAASLSSPGGSQTVQIDPSTGQLMSNELIQQQIIQNAMVWLAQQNSTLSMRSMTLGQNNTFFNSG
jgi:hypothetical protein